MAHATVHVKVTLYLGQQLSNTLCSAHMVAYNAVSKTDTQFHINIKSDEY
jgi:hypothetical protein